ncbi:MAG: alpha/beta fold hydrolase, partial [Ilyomonas sp.]
MRTFLLLLSVILLTHISFAQADSAGKYFNSFDNTKICYEIKGEGEPVILVHGFMNTADTWKKTALYSALLNAGFKVITPDLRGNG